MDVLLSSACGVDVHEKMIEACILMQKDSQIVPIRQRFSTLPKELSAFVKWLRENQCFDIAMESTGVYWKPVFETIEREIQEKHNIIVGNAYHIKNVPGRKSDVKDAEWIATLLMHGLISKSFVPDKRIRSLRDVARTYKKCVGENCRYRCRIEKFLQTHGYKLSSVMKDIFCVTGRNLLDSLARRGSLTLEDVTACRKGRLKSSALELFDAVNIPLDEIDRQLLSLLLDRLKTSESDLKKVIELMDEIAKPYSRQIEILDSIPGIDRIAALLIIAEISNAPQKDFSSQEKLTSWAGLAPRNDESASKIYSKKVLPGNQYLKTILNQVSWAAVKQRETPFHDWFWTRQGRLGKNKAITAVSRKMLKLIYTLISSNTLYNNMIALSNVNH